MKENLVILKYHLIEKLKENNILSIILHVNGKLSAAIF